MKESTKYKLYPIGVFILILGLFLLMFTCNSCTAVKYAKGYTVAFCTPKRIQCFDKDSNIVILGNPDRQMMFTGDSLSLREEFKLCFTP